MSFLDVLSAVPIGYTEKKKRRTPHQYPFETLKVGQSFTTDHDNRATPSCLAQRYQKSTGRKYSVKGKPGKWTITRVQ